ncbi:fumarylacetoacetate hydrolase family protein [Microbacterium trichothecenolyticum]|uniref:fumarylacetoacetate hydrolase family protein n=1 Tax=Microbacterium trichothecenolyticum TaxID=69370 RepID=UPI001C6E4B93|nr:fumarylacetoacetate hydrolase family protein [Microbacterium trichothecenolyticum]MBW9120485.1 fumarylacetoacetate hydrolase family protein [Microbacterium trichothecenolyticum]
MTAFAIASLLLEGEVVPAVIRDELVYDTRPALPAVARTADLFADWDRSLDLLTEHLERGPLPLGDVESLITDRGGRMLPPVQPVGPVIAAGANYREHIIQMSVAHGLGSDGASPEALRAEAAAEIDERVRTGDPYVWTGLPSAVSGAYDDVVLPDVGHDVDWELELGVYLGRTAHRVSPDDALRHVAGYTIVNDLTVRSLVPRNDMAKIGTDWFRAKNQPGFFPTGPWLVPARFVPDPGALAMTLRLNGELKQDATSADLAFDIPALISYASSVALLQPGDLLITGSPAGNGSHWGRFLSDGDVMEAEIAGLGAQRTVVRAASGELPPWQATRWR